MVEETLHFAFPTRRRADVQAAIVPAAREVVIVEVKAAFTPLIVTFGTIFDTGNEVVVERVAVFETCLIALATRTALSIAFPGKSFLTVTQEFALLQDVARTCHRMRDTIARIWLAQVGRACIGCVIPDEAGLTITSKVIPIHRRASIRPRVLYEFARVGITGIWSATRRVCIPGVPGITVATELVNCLRHTRALGSVFDPFAWIQIAGILAGVSLLVPEES